MDGLMRAWMIGAQMDGWMDGSWRQPGVSELDDQSSLRGQATMIGVD